jgi:hypothetical protein
MNADETIKHDQPERKSGLNLSLPLLSSSLQCLIPKEATFSEEIKENG